MLPGISSTTTMAKKKPGTRQARSESEQDGRGDRDRGDHIPITNVLFEKLNAFVETFPTQKAAAAVLEISEATITNVLKTRTQKTFKRDLYVRICKKLGMNTGAPLEQLVAAGGDLSADDIVALLGIAKRMRKD